MSEINYEPLRESDLIHTLAEAALINQEALGRSSKALDKAISAFNTQVSLLPSIVARQVKDDVITDVQVMLSNTADLVAREVTERLAGMNDEAERARAAVESARAEYERVTTFVVWKIALIAFVYFLCGILGVIFAARFVEH